MSLAQETTTTPQNDAAGTAAGAVVLPAILDMRAVLDLHTQLQAAVERAGDLPLDASAVERMSTPCAQVLLATDKTLAGLGSGHALRLVAASAAFEDTFRDLGYGAVLDKWSGSL